MKPNPLDTTLLCDARILSDLVGNQGIFLITAYDSHACSHTAYIVGAHEPRVTTDAPDHIAAQLLASSPDSLPISYSFDLTVDGETVGTVRIYPSHPGTSLREILPQVKLFAHLAGSGIKQAVENERLRDRLLYDMKTGARSFEWYLDHVAHLIEGTKRERSSPASDPDHRSFAIAGLDICGFGKWNVEIGHVRGDVLMTDVVDISRSSLRAVDEIVRFGGDEFLLVLPNTSYENGIACIRKLQDTIHAYPFRVVDNTGQERTIRLQLYTAVVSYPEQGETPLTLAQAVLHRIEQAKRSRHLTERNRPAILPTAAFLSDQRPDIPNPSSQDSQIPAGVKRLNCRCLSIPSVSTCPAPIVPS